MHRRTAEEKTPHSGDAKKTQQQHFYHFKLNTFNLFVFYLKDINQNSYNFLFVNSLSYLSRKMHIETVVENYSEMIIAISLLPTEQRF